MKVTIGMQVGIMVIMGIIAIILLSSITVTLKVSDVFMLIMLATFIAVVPYIQSVRFYSSLIAFEDGVILSTFNNRYEIIRDEILGNLAAVYHGGYKANRKYLSWPDITPSGDTKIVVMPIRMLEQIANGRFLVARGKRVLASKEEMEAFMQRDSVRRVFDGKVKHVIELSFAFSSSTLHPDVMPPGVNLEAIMSAMQSDVIELGSVSKEFVDENSRKLRFITGFRQQKQLDVIDVQRPKQDEREESR